MTRFADFLREHEEWPGFDSVYVVGRSAPAAALRGAYVAEFDGDPELRVLSQKEFGMAVVDAGYKRQHLHEGDFYVGLMVRSRRAEAEYRTREDLRRQLLSRPEHREWAARERGHMLHKHYLRGDVDGLCKHPQPDDVTAGVAAIEATLAGYAADGTLAQLVDEKWGHWLDWRPEGPNPRLLAFLERPEAEWPHGLRRALHESGEREDPACRAMDEFSGIVGPVPSDQSNDPDQSGEAY